MWALTDHGLTSIKLFLHADIDECAYYADCCHGDATCTNTEGSFTCSCNEGFTGDGKQCEGMDAVNCNYSQEYIMKRRESAILLFSHMIAIVQVYDLLPKPLNFHT